MRNEFDDEAPVVRVSDSPRMNCYSCCSRMAVGPGVGGMCVFFLNLHGRVIVCCQVELNTVSKLAEPIPKATANPEDMNPDQAGCVVQEWRRLAAQIPAGQCGPALRFRILVPSPVLVSSSWPLWDVLRCAHPSKRCKLGRPRIPKPQHSTAEEGTSKEIIAQT